MKKKINSELLKVSIGIPAFNEEKNIGSLIESILIQKEDGFKIMKIIVISDGSTDTSIQKVKQFKNKKIQLVEGKKRLGKSQRLNQIFKMAKGGIICLFDGDVVLSNNTVISRLINTLLSDNKVALVSGGVKPYPPRTFVERCVNVSREAYDKAKLNLNNGNNVSFCCGKILALRTSFAKSITIPSFITADDAFLYFSCISRGYKFISNRSAKVLFRSPATLADQIIQNTRYVGQANQGNTFKKLFGELVEKEYYIPKSSLYKSLLFQFLRSPFYSAGIFIINFYSKFLSKIARNQTQGKWIISPSTKGERYE